METKATGKKEESISMVRIDKTQHKKLKDLSRKFNLSQTDFVNYAVDYFAKTGINPADKIYSPREEISKLEKRVEQVIKFLNVFQREQAKPVFDELVILNKAIMRFLPLEEMKLPDDKGVLTTKNDIGVLIRRINELEEKLTKK